MEISVALGLRPDYSNHYHQINFFCLLARYYIWICKKKETAPRIEGFIKYLKSVYDIEVKTGAKVPKKWEILKSFFEKVLSSTSPARSVLHYLASVLQALQILLLKLCLTLLTDSVCLTPFFVYCVVVVVVFFLYIT